MANGHRKDQIDLEVFFSLLFIRKKTIVAAVLLTLAIALAYSLLMPSQYESTAKILAEPHKQENPYLLESRSDKERKMFMETQKEILVSNTVIKRTISDLKSKPIDQVTKSEIESLLNSIGLPSRSGLGKNPFSGSGIGESNTFFVTVRSNSPEAAAQSVNALVENYIETASDLRKQQARTAAQILESSIQESREWAKNTYEQLGEFEAETGSLLIELINMDKPSVRVYPELEKLREQYETTRSEIAQKQSLVAELKAALQGEGIPAIPKELMASNPNVELLKEKIAGMRIEMGKLKPFFNNNAREVQSYEMQIIMATNDLKNEVQKILDGEKQSLVAMESAQAERREILDDYEARMKKLSLLNGEHKELKREYDSAGEVMTTQLENLATAKITAAERASGMANIAVIDYGIRNDNPVSPNLWRNIIISIPVGLGIGILLILLGQLAHPVYVHPRQLEESSGVPVVALLYPEEVREEAS